MSKLFVAGLILLMVFIVGMAFCVYSLPKPTSENKIYHVEHYTNQGVLYYKGNSITPRNNASGVWVSTDSGSIFIDGSYSVREEKAVSRASK